MRPAALAFLRRHAQLAIAAALALAAPLLFGRLALAGAPVAAALLALMLAAAAWLARDALMRLRLSASAAPGVVTVREGRIVCFGPVTGGVLDIDALAVVALEPTADGPAWRLAAESGETLVIPLGAVGASALIDAFAALPGFEPARAAAAARDGRACLLWRRTGPPPAPALASTPGGPYISRH